MSNQTYKEVAATTFPQSAKADGVTIQMKYNAAKSFLSNKPLRRPKRNWPSCQDHRDIRDAEQRISDPAETPIPYDQARRGLELE